MADLYDIAFARNMSGGGGTSDYDDLTNKPQINGVTLSGNKTGADLGLVPAENGKGLSTEDYTTAEKTKLAGIEPEANKTVVDTEINNTSTNPVENKAVYEALSGKVDKVNGKGLSTEDYTTAEKTKLAELTKDYTNLNNKPQINGTTLTGDKSSADLGLLSASTRYGASISSNKYIEPMTGKKLIDTILKDQNGNAMATITSDQPVIDIGCDSSGLLVTYPSARASVSLGAAMSGKVDKVQGKGLSTEDFTAMYKAWLDVSMLSPTNHNAIFRGKDLTNVYTIDQMYSRIHSGNFDDLFLGDYINVSITTTLPDETAKTETVSLMIAAFDYYYNIGDTALTTHHVIFVPRDVGFSTASKMNDTNTTVGSYLHSYMHETVLPCYAASLKVALNNHVLSHRTLLPNAINSSTPSMAGAGLAGASSGWAWTTVELQLMTEQQVYGTRAWTSSAYDIGVDYRKLPVFDFINPAQYGRGNFWLRSVVSSTHFAFCYVSGGSGYSDASVSYYVRPLIVFG